jgi:hypothetical protein
MRYTCYPLHVLIPKRNPFSLDDAYEALSERFRYGQYKAKVENLTSEYIRVHYRHWNQHWRYHILWGGQPTHFEKVPSFVEVLQRQRSDWDVIVTSDRFIECRGDNDPTRRYHYHFEMIVGTLERIHNLYLFFPHTGELWKSGEQRPFF